MAPTTTAALVLVLFSLGCSPPGVPGPTAAPPTARPTVVDGFASPESVLGVGARRFVSNIGEKLDPFAKDGDGFISELDEDGTIIELRAFPRSGSLLHAPKGMAAVRNTLYVADVDRVVGFDLSTHVQVFEAVVESPALLNDLDAESDVAILVTDTVKGTVSRLQLADGAFSPVARDIPGANGVAIDRASRIAWIVGLGTALSGGQEAGAVFAVPLDGGAVRQLKAARGLFDGVAMLPSGELLVSDWVAIDKPTPGRLATYRATGERGSTLALPSEVHGPADFYYDAARNELWIPQTLDNRVMVVRVARAP